MMDQGIIDLPRELYAAALGLEITSISLHFSGGNDEGSLEVDVTTKEKNRVTSYSAEYSGQAAAPDSEEQKSQLAVSVLITTIEDWANEAYDYSGAGDGSDYGDDITYDLTRNKVVTHEWYMQRHDDDAIESPLKLAKQVSTHERK